MQSSQNTQKPAGQNVCESCYFLKVTEGVQPPTIQKLMQCHSLRAYRPGQCVQSQDAKSPFIYCLASGRVDMNHADRTGRNYLIHSFIDSGTFPLTSLFDEKEIEFSLTAKAPSIICRFPMKAFLDALKGDSILAVRVLQRFVIHQSRARYRLISLLGKNASIKVGSILFNNMSGDTNTCTLTRTEIAEWTNLAPETVIRTLTQMEKKGLIKKTRRGIHIPDPDQLRYFLGH